MVSIDRISYFLCYVAMGVLVVNMTSRFYLGQLKLRVADLFLIILAIACLLAENTIIETFLFFTLSASLFKEIAKFKISKSAKVIGFFIIAVNACVLYYIQTQASNTVGSSLAVLWLYLTFLLGFPILHSSQQEIERLRNANFFHFVLRIAAVLTVNRYIQALNFNVVWIYALLGIFMAILLLALFYKKIVVSKMVIQAHVSALLILLSFVFPHGNLGLLVVIAALIYILDTDSESVQTHNRRWLEMLEWPTWQSPIFLLLILTVYAVKDLDLKTKTVFVAYVFIIGAVGVFGPEHKKIAAVSAKQRNSILAKSGLLAAATLVLERWL
jgi:hypothetical protein